MPVRGRANPWILVGALALLAISTEACSGPAPPRSTSTTTTASGEPPPPTPAEASFCDLDKLFIPTVLAQLTAHFGYAQQCGFYESDTWAFTLTGSVSNASVPPQPAPFGSFAIAVEHCLPGDSSCKEGTDEACSSGYSTCHDPSTPHNFSDFEVYRPPYWPEVVKPGGGIQPLIGTTDGITLLSVPDGPCGSIDFEVNNATW